MLERIPGRAERIEAGQDFLAIVDYAHTPDSLQALYDAYQTTERFACSETLVADATHGNDQKWVASQMKRATR